MTAEAEPLDAAAAQRLREAIMAGLPNGKRLLTLRRIEAAIDRLTAAMDDAIKIDEPVELDHMLNLVLSEQRRALHIPDGDGAGARFQELAAAWQANTLPADQRTLYERNATAANIRFKLRVTHNELTQPQPAPPPEEAQLIAQMQALAAPLEEAKAHTIPGTITAEWLDRLASSLAQHRALLATVTHAHKFRAHLCYTMASAAYALGRGHDQLAQPRQARDAYAEAAQLYRAAGEPDDAAAADDQVQWLTFALTADIDGGSYDDLERLAHGIADPLGRANTLHRLGRRAIAANDQVGALRYAEATAAALTDAGFSDPQSGAMPGVLANWVDAAITRRSGGAVPRLLQKIGDMVLTILTARHADQLRNRPDLAPTTEARIARLNAGLMMIVAQPGLVATEVHRGLLPYMPNLGRDETEADPGYQRALALWPRINILSNAAEAEAEPADDIIAEAASIVAEASDIGQPGLTASACLAQARLLARRNDLVASAAAAAAGEATLLPAGANDEALSNPNIFAFYLMLREHRLQVAAQSGNFSGVLALAEGAITALEAARYRNSDPYQQGAYLSERTRFYEMAAFSAFKLERWDALITVMDLFRSRSALRNRLAPPPDESVAALADRLAAATQAIEAAPEDRKPALRDNRRVIWSLLSIARLRGAGGERLPELSVAAVQRTLAPDEAVVAWVWVGTGVLLVVAIDPTGIHAERVILDDDQRNRLARYVKQLRSGRIAINSLGQTVETLTDAVLPPATRAFVAAARRLILSPHRSLHLVPFHAARIDGQFLIERAAIRYVPNFASLLIPWAGNRTGEVIAVGINAFGLDQVPDLVTAEAEAQAVAAAWRASGVTATALTGAAATRAAFTGLPLGRCRCLHLATHGSSVISGEFGGDPFASRLYFRDGEIEALTLAELPLHADLVVMSACHSGQRALDLPGLAELPGDDLFGLQAMLFQAGVHAVIGALWPMNDNSALSILPVLHRHLAAGDAPELALQAALCAYLRAPDAPPQIFYWAPLFMTSIGRPVDPTQERAL